MEASPDRLGGWGEVKLAAMRPRTEPRLLVDEPVQQPPVFLVQEYSATDLDSKSCAAYIVLKRAGAGSCFDDGD